MVTLSFALFFFLRPQLRVWNLESWSRIPAYERDGDARRKFWIPVVGVGVVKK